MDEAYYWDLLRPLIDGRKVILAGGMIGGSGPLVEQVRRLGASDVFLLAQAQGTGETPDGVPCFDLGVTGDNMMDALRASLSILRNLPDAAVTALSRFDPEGTAVVIGDMFNDVESVAGRPCLAWRRPAWIAVEDKVTIDARWDRWGIERAPSLIVPADEASLRDAAERLDHGHGTVWAADAREGWNGGAEYTHRVRNDDDVAAAAAFLAAHAGRARVTPFLEGVPCSIHGIVFEDDVAVFRPLEIITLRHRHSSDLFYAGLASFWDPAPGDREAMREVARRAGAGLRRDVDYRGAFTVDGVMTVEGFRPTELNARAGGGLSMLGRSLPDLPLNLLVVAAGGGHRLDYRPRQLEELVVASADARRTGGTWRAIEARTEMVSDEPLLFEDGTWRTAQPGERAHGRLMAGHAPSGSLVRLSLDADRWPVGPSVATAAAAFWRFANERLAAGIPPLDAPRDVRSEPGAA